ncbi:heavy metal-associated isoprenylated plant protein 3-like [Phalaenopsis equestris]|uniref:heavy metal-associated isoprenylated plant protein 3-like n=1 Tax=Phalaenopsis equestris TaxID=78828 RepID=UPI0009E3DBC7|nr:heavy metal-associated isoprenylated plant protein 3-like [Phalaenopsis equestris]
MEVGPITVVLKVEMHCKGCAQKVRRSVKGFKGVEGVASDVTGSKLTVIGKVDPVELRNHLESKMHKKVEIISPAVAVKKEKESSKADGNEGAKDQKPDQSKEQKKADDKKPNEPSVTSVTLKIRLHCEGCIERIRKQINKIKGVESVSFDSEKDLVTVKGSMDVTTLPGFLMAKLNRGVEIVNPKKDGDGDKEKSEKKKGSEGQDAAKTVTAAPAAPATPASMEARKMDYYRSFGFPHHSEIIVGPQLFSDENPNACSIM